MDIAEFDTVAEADAGAVMEVRSPKTGEVLRHPPDANNPDGRPFTINYIGKDSPKVVALARQQNDRRIKQMRRTGETVQTSLLESDAIDLLVAATTGWDVILNKETAKSDAGSYRSAYVKYPWLYEQGNEFVGLRSNFTKA